MMIPTEPIGSIPRPPALVAALAAALHDPAGRSRLADQIDEAVRWRWRPP